MLALRTINIMKLSMKVLAGAFMSLLLLSITSSMVHGQDGDDWQKERAAANDAAGKALSDLKRLLSSLDEDSFSTEPSDGAVKIGSVEIPSGTPKISVLRQQIQFLIAQIDLAQDYPETKFRGEATIDNLVKGKDFFGVSAAQNFGGFEARQKLIEKLFEDSELGLGNRLFGLIKTGKDPDSAGLIKWVKFVERMAGPYYLGTTFERQPSTLGRSLKALCVLRGVTNSPDFKAAMAENSDLEFQFNSAMEKKLKPAVKEFARERYVKGGMLRDWSLPVASAAARVFPDLNRDVIGITTLQDYQKTALSHARAVTQLVENIDDLVASPKETNRALTTIKFYRDQSYYIGSNEVREAGTLRVPMNEELEVILANAQFFAPDGHRNIKTYQKRSEHLDSMFFGEGSENNLELLISLKSADEWLEFFDAKLLGGKKKTEEGVFPYISENHEITLDQLKIMFFARAVLPSDSFKNLFAADSPTHSQYERLLADFGEQVREISSLQFRNYPKQWINVQNGFQELAKGFEKYSFDKLKVTTSTDLAMVRKDFEEGLYGRDSVAEDFLQLMVPDSPHVIPSIDHMTSSDLAKRVGKFDKQLSPEFVNRMNAKLSDVLEYRSYGLAAIDSLERPDLQAGRIMTHFAVSDYRVPGDKKTNTVMHDLICGPEGGFGGLGMLFRPDAKGYKERESVLDAIATSDELILGDVLFNLALDINRNNETSDEDLARAASRWITYFRKSQANAQFHAVPDVLNQAIRGTFLSRIVFKSESFQKALENSRTSPVGSTLDISYDLEAALSAQIRKMQSMLAKIDPETATNRNINETAEKWQDFKVWYLESNKWLETMITDPLLISELSRVRKMKRKVTDYQELCPEVVVFKKAIEHFGGEIYSEPAPPTLELARFAMEQITQLEPDLNMPLPEMEGTPDDMEKLRQLEFGKAVSSQFLNDIRRVVRESGFEEIAEVSDPLKIGAIYNSVLADEARLNTANSELVKNRAKAMEEGFKAAIARAISRVEADQPSDFKVLEGQAIRASKVDRILSENELAQYRIDIEPSLVVHEWINQNRSEIMADYRSVELRAEARQMINKAKQERRSMIEVQTELQAIKAENLHKTELLQEWVDKSEGGTNVEVVMEEVISMRQEVTSLKKEVAVLKDSETLMRARAADFAQKLFHYKRSGASPEDVNPISDEMLKEISIASAPEPLNKPTVSPRNTATVRTTPSRNTSRSSSASRSSGGGFFQRLFGRRR